MRPSSSFWPAQMSSVGQVRDAFFILHIIHGITGFHVDGLAAQGLQRIAFWSVSEGEDTVNYQPSQVTSKPTHSRQLSLKELHLLCQISLLFCSFSATKLFQQFILHFTSTLLGDTLLGDALPSHFPSLLQFFRHVASAWSPNNRNKSTLNVTQLTEVL